MLPETIVIRIKKFTDKGETPENAIKLAFEEENKMLETLITKPQIFKKVSDIICSSVYDRIKSSKK